MHINPFRYRSYYYDTETGLYYLQTRYYDPRVGRFINADALSYLGADGELRGYNLYTYCGNNPVMKVDPTGTISKEWAWVVSGILIVGGIVLSVATAGLAAPGVLGTLATVGGWIGGAVVAAGAGSLIGGYLNEAAGGSFDAGYWGGMVSGAITGLGAGVGGSLYMKAVGSTKAVRAFLYSSGVLTVPFAFGTAGSMVGSYATSAIDGAPFDWEGAMQTALICGSLNMLAGIGSVVVAGFGSVAYAPGAVFDTKIAARLVATLLVMGFEAGYDILSYLLGLI